MSRTTGPILAVGAITIANETLIGGKPLNWRIPVATGLAAGIFAFAERGWADGAVALAWLSLTAVVFVRIDPKTPAPAESFVTWWNG